MKNISSLFPCKECANMNNVCTWVFFNFSLSTSISPLFTQLWHVDFEKWTFPLFLCLPTCICSANVCCPSPAGSGLAILTLNPNWQLQWPYPSLAHKLLEPFCTIHVHFSPHTQAALPPKQQFTLMIELHPRSIDTPVWAPVLAVKAAKGQTGGISSHAVVLKQFVFGCLL